MKNYIAPTIEVEEIEVKDLVLASGYQLAELKGVDSNGEKSAVFNAGFWFSNGY